MWKVWRVGDDEEYKDEQIRYRNAKLVGRVWVIPKIILPRREKAEGASHVGGLSGIQIYASHAKIDYI